MRQGEQVTIEITDLDDQGNGVGRYDGRVIFVPDTAVGDRVQVRLLQVKTGFARAKLTSILQSSADRIRPHCIVADKCGGCQWQHVAYKAQLAAKQNQVGQALERIGGFSQPPIAPVLAAEATLRYRNKSTFPLGISRGDTNASPILQAGYYQRGTHHLINLNQCPVQDDRLDRLLREIKQDLQQHAWPVYEETQHRGELRHLSLRVGRRTGELLITLVSRTSQLPGLTELAQVWRRRYAPHLVGVTLNLNPDRTNAIFGEQTHCIAGRPYLREIFAGMMFQVEATAFFQVFTEQAEAMLHTIAHHLQLQGQETLIDAYCGLGAFTLPLARQTQRTIGLEIHAPSIQQARQNAQINGLPQVEFYCGAVETLLPTLQVNPDVVLLDPPRKGCEPQVLECLRQMRPERLVYVSCKPATLARDLKRLCADHLYRLVQVQPVDFFPQTTHVECVAFLQRG